MRFALALCIAAFAFACASTSPKQAVAPQQVTTAAAAPASTGGPGGDQDTRATFEKGLSEVRQGDLGAAERSFKSVLERDPKLAPASASSTNVVYCRTKRNERTSRRPRFLPAAGQPGNT